MLVNSELQAILCKQDTVAVFCDRCKKFRFVYCYLDNRAICADCTVALRLKPIKSVTSDQLPVTSKRTRRQGDKKRASPVTNPKSKIQNLKSKITTLVTLQIWILARSYQLLAFSCWWYAVGLKLTPKVPKKCKQKKIKTKCNTKKEFIVKRRLIQLLADEPASSISLTRKLGCTQSYTVEVAKELIAQGKIIGRREKTRRACQWYALPDQAKKLPDLMGKGVKDKILELLKNTPWLSTKQMRQHLPEYRLDTVRESAWRLTRAGELIGRGQGELRRYSLPENRQLLEKSHSQISQAIIDLLKQSPGLWQQAIVRRLPYPERTVGDHIKRMKQSGILSQVRLKSDRRTFLYVNTSETDQ